MADKSVPQWEVFESSFSTDKRFDNPFLDVELTVVFKSGDHHLWIDGFYDGNEKGKEVWRVRFAPPHVGSWEYTTVSNETALNGLTGCFECAEPVSRGGLTVNPQFPNWFFRSDGRPQFVVNDGWAPHPGFGNLSGHETVEFEQPSEDEYKTYLEILGRYRVNMVVEVNQVYSRQDHITDTSFRGPWKVLDPKKNKIDRDRFNLEYYKRLDRTLAFAKERGIFYGVELLNDNSIYRPADWSHHPWNIENGGWLADVDGDDTGFGEGFDLDNELHVRYLQRFLDYTVARTSAYWNVFYALGAESGNIDRPRADTFAVWYEYWGDFVARKDPHGRLQAIGDTGECPQLVRHRRNNIMITQEHTSMDHTGGFCRAINRFGERFWTYARPTIIGEQDRNNNNKFEAERKGYWLAFVSGFMMGRVDRHYAIAEGKRLYESKLFELEGDPPIYADLNRMADFIDDRNVNFWRMSPRDDLIVGETKLAYCLAEPNREYLLYLVQGGSPTVSLPEGAFETIWYNPRNGEFGEKSIIEGGRSHSFTAPDSGDWVLHIVSNEIR